MTRSDGSIAENAFVVVGYPDVIVNEDGIAGLELLAGAPYEVRAAANVYGTGVGSITISPKVTAATIVIK